MFVLASVLLACGVAGLAGCFLPLQGPLSFWSLRGMNPTGTLLPMAAFAVAIVMAAGALVRPPMVRTQAIIAGMAFAFVLVRLRDVIVAFATDGALGARMIAFGAAGGLIAAVACAVRAEPDRA